MNTQATHWADIYAEKIIREKGNKDLYVCASGVTPSGTVHIGNFREIISTDLVVRALKKMGKKVRFIFSWDDYDVFRKVPQNMPRQQMLANYLRKPITVVPDPYKKQESYARHNEKELEELLSIVGINPEFIYQAQQYNSSRYAQQMYIALCRRKELIEILNEHRKQPLSPDWWPLSVFCTSCHKDTTTITSWDGKYGISYECSSCGNKEKLDLNNATTVKLFWRVDWPMRWAYEKVDFEPAGKDHHSEGGSFDTARKIVAQVFKATVPVTFQYDFISIKGRGGKISSSSGEVISLKDVLEIYQPQVVRYLFAGTRPNSEFSISFDLDVIKIYEDYDRCERVYYGEERISEKKQAKQKRIYELSQITEIAEQMSPQVPFRHLCNLLQIHEGNIHNALKDFKAQNQENMLIRARCAWNWITAYAPQDFRFQLRNPDAAPQEITEQERDAIIMLRAELEKGFESLDQKSLAELIYNTANSKGIEARHFFKVMYRVLINKEKGPRLAGFILNIGKEKIMQLLAKY